MSFRSSNWWKKRSWLRLMISSKNLLVHHAPPNPHPSLLNLHIIHDLTRSYTGEKDASVDEPKKGFMQRLIPSGGKPKKENESKARESPVVKEKPSASKQPSQIIEDVSSDQGESMRRNSPVIGPWEEIPPGTITIRHNTPMLGQGAFGIGVFPPYIFRIWNL